jgi:serine/threonine-protein kinase
MVQACAGIGYAHRAGLVHCDIKPHNIVVTPDHRLKVADFGIARALASIRPEEKMDIVWGSPQYFSPEQAAGAAPSPASDVYSLGVVIYEMLTGQLPFIATTAIELARLHREASPPSPRQLNPAIPTALEQIILKVLSKEPSARYRTADQLGRVLLNYQKTGQVSTGSSPVRVTRPRAEATRHPDQAQPSRLPETSTLSQPIFQPVLSPAPLVPEIELPPVKEENPFDIDWGTIALGLLALLAVGGLIPFWLWIYFVYNPPIR